MLLHFDDLKQHSGYALVLTICQSSVPQLSSNLLASYNANQALVFLEQSSEGLTASLNIF